MLKFSVLMSKKYHKKLDMPLQLPWEMAFFFSLFSFKNIYNKLTYNNMENKRKQEIEKCLKEIKTYAYYMAKSLRKDHLLGEEIAFNGIKSELELMIALYEDLQDLRGK